MAVYQTCQWEVRTTGGSTNGGGYVPGGGGVDYSQQPTAQYTLTGLTANAADTVINTASAASDMVGNIICIHAGTNFILGFYEIISVSVGVSITVDRACTGASAGSSGQGKIGGAFKTGTNLDDEFFEAITGGNIVWFQSGTHTLGEAVSVASSGSTSTLPSEIIGYNATRGDNPLGSDRPVMDTTTYGLTFGAYQNLSHLSFKTTVIGGITVGAGSRVRFCKFVNNSPTVGRAALTSATDGIIYACEAVSIAGTAFNMNGHTSKIIGCYAHDSMLGYSCSNSRIGLFDCIAQGCRTTGVKVSSSSTSYLIKSFTIFGFNTPVTGSSGILIDAAVVNTTPANCILCGVDVGIKGNTSQYFSNHGFCNAFYNNNTNATFYTLDSTDITGVDPGFADTTEINGTTATTIPLVLTDSSADFSTVTDNEDYLHIISGTSAATGIYPIVSHTSTTLTVLSGLSMGNSSAGDVVYIIVKGRNLSIGTGLKAAGFPSLYGASTSNYLDIGAVQRQEPTSGPGGEYSIISLS